MKFHLRRTLALVLFATPLLGWSQAAPWPSKPIRAIVRRRWNFIESPWVISKNNVVRRKNKTETGCGKVTLPA